MMQNEDNNNNIPSKKQRKLGGVAQHTELFTKSHKTCNTLISRIMINITIFVVEKYKQNFIAEEGKEQNEQNNSSKTQKRPMAF